MKGNAKGLLESESVESDVELIEDEKTKKKVMHKLIKGYKLTKEIGKGSFGTVYKGKSHINT